jgi:hypothetical protein
MPLFKDDLNMKTSRPSRILKGFLSWRSGAALLLVVATSLWHPGLLRAETTNYSGATQITALPYTISSPGTYYVAQNFTVNMASGNCINITCSGVTIDLDGHTITNSNGASTGAAGIYASNMTNITILNGTISGFYYGILLSASVFTPSSASFGHLVQNINFVKNTYIALFIQGVGCRCYQCRAVLTGGGTSSLVYSFVLFGSGCSIEDCDACGQTGSGTSYGVYIGGGNDNFAVNNRISEVDSGICVGSGGGGKYRDTLTSTVITPYTGGSNAGNNN